MTFRSEAVPKFLQNFAEVKNKIRAFPGCHHLELLRGTKDSHILFTYSYWESEEILNAYRHSDLFKSTWKKAKIFFEEKAEAWSVEVISMA